MKNPKVRGKKIIQDPENQKKDDKKFEKFQNYLKKFDNYIIAVAVLVASFIWFSVFKGLVQYMPVWAYLPLLFISTLVVSSFFSKIPSESQDRKRRLIKWLPILLVFVFHFLPALDMAKVSNSGEKLEWINIENGKNYHRPANKVHEDGKGEYFFDPITGDTCRKATNYWREVYRERSHTPVSVYVTKYDTLINEVYSSRDANSQGVLRTNVYGYDLNKMRNPEIVITNLKDGDESSVVIGHVNTCVDIYASYRNPEARYRYKTQVVKNLDLSIPLTFKGSATKARVLVLEETRVRQNLAQN
jgi:hypothetical protein